MEDEKKNQNKTRKSQGIQNHSFAFVRMKTFIYFKKKCAKTSREEQLLSNFVKEPKMRKKKQKCVVKVPIGRNPFKRKVRFQKNAFSSLDDFNKMRIFLLLCYQMLLYKPAFSPYTTLPVSFSIFATMCFPNAIFRILGTYSLILRISLFR